MQQKIEKKYGIPIIILVIATTIISILIQHFPSESEEQGKLIDSTLTATGVSIFALMLLILKKATCEKYITDALQVLLIIMIPVTTFIPIVSEPEIFWYFFPIFYGAVCGWFLGVNYFIIKTGVRDEEQQNATSIMKRLFGFLMGLSIIIFFLYFVAIIPQLNYPTN